LFVRHGDTDRNLAGEVYEVLDRSDSTEIRAFVEERYPEELVFRVVSDTGLSSNTDYQAKLVPLDYYPDRCVHLEYGPDGARTGLAIDEVRETHIR
jgi:hypothetical protein